MANLIRRFRFSTSRSIFHSLPSRLLVRRRIVSFTHAHTHTHNRADQWRASRVAYGCPAKEDCLSGTVKDHNTKIKQTRTHTLSLDPSPVKPRTILASAHRPHCPVCSALWWHHRGWEGSGRGGVCQRNRRIDLARVAFFVGSLQ